MPTSSFYLAHPDETRSFLDKLENILIDTTISVPNLFKYLKQLDNSFKKNVIEENIRIYKTHQIVTFIEMCNTKNAIIECDK